MSAGEWPQKAVLGKPILLRARWFSCPFSLHSQGPEPIPSSVSLRSDLDTALQGTRSQERDLRAHRTLTLVLRLAPGDAQPRLRQIKRWCNHLRSRPVFRKRRARRSRRRFRRSLRSRIHQRLLLSGISLGAGLQRWYVPCSAFLDRVAHN